MTKQRQLSEEGRLIARETGSALSALGIPINTRPEPRTNTLVVTHKTNIQDAFGKTWADIKEGESLLFKPDGSGSSAPVARVPASDWIALAHGR
jgi:hypothetical protein